MQYLEHTYTKNYLLLIRNSNSTGHPSFYLVMQPKRESLSIYYLYQQRDQFLLCMRLETSYTVR